jgi:sugar lactone lactonase YvrE
MQSQTPYGSARMMCRVWGSLAQVLRLAVTSRASIWRRAKARLAHSSAGKTNLCNDMTVASDGTVYVTNSLTPQILQLKPGGKALEVWVEDKRFQPPSGAGLDGIAIGGDSNIYVNTFNSGEFFRVEVKDASHAPSQSLKRHAR